MDDDEAALLAEPVAPRGLDLDVPQTGLRDLVLQRLVDRGRAARAAAGVRAYADGDGVRRTLLDDLLLESIEALVRAKLREFQRRPPADMRDRYELN
jgi:hypothetical protein